MAFHPYPRVVPSVFNRSGFGPPRGLTPASACPWIDRPASRPRRATHAPLEARFRCGSFPNLTSPHAATRWLILQKARRHPARGLRLLAGARFQALFHSPLGVLFTFPSRYLFAIGRGRVFSLGGWSPLLPAGFLVPGGTLGRRRSRARFAYGALTLCRRPSQAVPLRARFLTARGVQDPRPRRPTTPSRQPSWGMRSRGFGPGPVSLAATPGISVDFSSSGYLDVSVPPVAPRALCVRARVREHDLSWVPPFGNPRINGRLRLPAAYRSLPRPSSTSRAKASAVRPSYLRSAPRARAGRRPAYIRSVLLKMRPPSRGMEGLCKRSIARYAAVKVRGGAHALAGAGAPEAGCWEAGGLKGPSFGLASP